ncbi:MAG: DNA repair protein RecO [Patescibacteria group bacterium]|nr:DNA repair protein RecO [Patescibacteria group bacterium]
MLAIVLSRRDYRENDQLVNLLTLEKGKISVLAKGVKKIISKNSAFLEPFFLVEVEIVPGRGALLLTKAIGVNGFIKIRKNLDKILIAAKAVALVDRLVKEGEHEGRLFIFLHDWLAYVNDHRTSRSFLFGFISRLFGLLGFAPQLAGCIVCGKKVPSGRAAGDFAFSPAGGGLVCAGCASSHRTEPLARLSTDDLINWQKIMDKKIVDWPEKLSPTLERAIRRFVEYHSEKKLAKISGI